jgi:hypothetical protein
MVRFSYWQWGLAFGLLSTDRAILHLRHKLREFDREIQGPRTFQYCVLEYENSA